jgi:cell fate regulator YaaT (PSP1 superfamily)
MADKSIQDKPDLRYIVGLRLQKGGKIYYFDATNVPELKPGDYALVETSRGRQLGQMIMVVDNPIQEGNGTLKPVLRRATPQDLLQKQSWEKKEVEALINCREKTFELGLSDVKIVATEFSFDGNRLYVMYSSEAGEKADLKSLRRALQRLYGQTHIEMHLIGPRDVAKILGGMGACGLETRCCSAFITEFSPISIKMAKEQGISLTPTEITGMCGRLRCCLVYEYEQYVEARKILPKRGKRVSTPMGEGKVVDIYPLKSAVLVELDKGGQYEFMKHEIQPLEELENLKRKADNGCEKQTNGKCDCGKNGDS